MSRPSRVKGVDDNLPAGSHWALSVSGHVWAWATLSHYGDPLRRRRSLFGTEPPLSVDDSEAESVVFLPNVQHAVRTDKDL